MTPRIVLDSRDATTLYRYEGEIVVDKGGYILLWNEVEGRYFSQHRLVAEAALGRRLLTTEEVHHINGVRWHNTPGNLIVCEKEYHDYLDAVMRLKRRGIGLRGRLKQWATISHFFRWVGRLSSDQQRIQRKIREYTSHPFIAKDIPRLPGSLRVRKR